VKLKKIILQGYQKDGLKIFDFTYLTIDKFLKDFHLFSGPSQLVIEISSMFKDFKILKSIYTYFFPFKTKDRVEFIASESKFNKNFWLTLTFIVWFLFFTVKNFNNMEFELEKFPPSDLLKIRAHLPTKKIKETIILSPFQFFYNFFYLFIFLVTYQAVNFKSK